ncbi:membrane protein [Actinomycetospora sp. NBRC 106375]|uniref:saccharopine dehydrogenase NADP-binding domain-containing protein n=1 Tax=Actinomycetospora sp. NBRC 106375 TaxID=3032207 RepID=UPI0024A59393|nr:saccharopine dehydrogenase NADP-binding domain-containing protein [Actinomycetospora sp. NBRC 106375]GLZ47547.1 membrane protein [Actinomycetospora sp. NBRC 106375]
MSGSEIWILGATGRSGRAIAARVAGRGAPVALVGRDAERLQEVAAGTGDGTGGVRSVVAGDVAAMAERIRSQHPAVVVNTVGPFAATAVPVARACLAGGSHYLDLANDVASAGAVLHLHDEAVAAGRTVVTGAGFGIVAAEAAVTALCRDRPVPAAVRTDTVPSLASDGGRVGEALAASLIDALPDGGRRYRDGRLVRTRLGADAAEVALPDGDRVTTVGAPFGDLVAAWRASGAPDVVAATSELPSSPPARVALPLAGAVLSIGPLRRVARRRFAEVSLPARDRPREHSWARATGRWDDGTAREQWLRLGDASEFTSTAAAVVATRLAAGRARPGADTPVAALGLDVATEAGGTLLT